MGRWHADAALHAGGRLVAVADPDESRARDLTARYRGAIVAADLDAAVQAARPTVAHICTPLATHQALALRAIELGLHVVLEKPLAPDAAAARALLDAAATRGVLLIPTHQFLYQPGVVRAVAELPSLGPLRHIETIACTAGAEGGDAAARDLLLGEILPHPLALLARLLPQPLSRVAWHVEHPAPGELRATGSSGAVSISVLLSAAGRPTRNELHVIAERGTVHVDLFHGFAVTETGQPSRLEKIARPFALASRTLFAASANLAGRAARAEPAYPGLRELVRQFYVAVQQRGAPPVGAAETLDCAAARDAILSLVAAQAR